MSNRTARCYREVMRETEKGISNRTYFVNRRGKVSIPKRHHLTKSRMARIRKKFQEYVQNHSSTIKEKAGDKFFNPYRAKSVYFYCVQSLYELGANEYHPFSMIVEKISNLMSVDRIDEHTTRWDKFVGKVPMNSMTAKDEIGRLFHNFHTLQRLGGLHPYGWKLKQVCSCIDIIWDQDIHEFRMRLNTDFEIPEDVEPIYINKTKRGKKK